MDRVTASNARHRILHSLKVGGESTTAALADMLGLSEMTLRQHFETLERLELVKRRLQSRKVPGRRAILWTLTELSSREFPERHAELTVALLDAARETFGEDGLSKIIESRADREVEAYKGLMPRKSASLRRKIDALARQRTLEGYMAEVVREGKGVYLFIEHHCPICEAARCCVGLCAAELRVFQEALGPEVTVERTRHLIKGDDRCVYRISGAWAGSRGHVAPLTPKGLNNKAQGKRSGVAAKRRPGSRETTQSSTLQGLHNTATIVEPRHLVGRSLPDGCI